MSSGAKKTIKLPDVPTMDSEMFESQKRPVAEIKPEKPKLFSNGQNAFEATSAPPPPVSAYFAEAPKPVPVSKPIEYYEKIHEEEVIDIDPSELKAGSRQLHEIPSQNTSKSVQINEVQNIPDEEVPVEDISNMVIERGVLKKYIGSTPVILIPDHVFEIGENAFSRNESVKKVVMTDSVKIIQRLAFMYCSNLEEVKFSKSLTMIGENAFLKCEKLKEAKLPNSLMQIEKGAFEKCVSLEYLVLPDYLQKISDFCFRVVSEFEKSNN